MQKQFEVNGPVELDVRLPSGEIEVEATDDATRVELELIAHDEDSQQFIDEARIELRDQQGRPHLTIDIPQRRGGFNFGSFFGRQGITLRVRAPHGSGLSVRTKSADLSAAGTLGGANIASASGDVMLERIEGKLSVKTASGDVRARFVRDDVSVQSASGDIAIDEVRGAVSVNSASGDVRIDEAYGDVNAGTVSGDQHHGAVMRGTISAHSVSGDVHIGVRRGSKVFLDCTTVSGDTSSELEVSSDAPAGDGPLAEIRAKTVSGDIQITRAPAPAADAGNTFSSDSSQEVHA
jgi:DUF4097 and DUF4098 domain-containing protein YvlB